jgi:hypothetical protein
MANDRLAINSGREYFYPGFARYGAEYSRVLTNWLFADPGNPFANQPDRWADIATVRDRGGSLLFDGSTDTATRGTGLGIGASQTLNFEFNGGRNYIIWGRTGTAVEYTGTPDSVNTDLIDYSIRLTDGTILDPAAPVTTGFGSGEQPYVHILPQMMLGTQRMQVTVTNRTGAAGIFVTLSFKYFFLDLVGR